MSIEAMKQALDELESLQPIMANGLLEQRQLDFIDPHIDRAITTLRAAIEQAEKQEPFCYHDGRNIVGKEYADHSDVFPLYTAPPRQWQGLTDEEIIKVIHPLVIADIADEATDYEIARAIEVKLRERNT